MDRADLDLVLLPGLDGSDAMFRPLCQALAGRLRPLVVSFPPGGAQDCDSLTRYVRERIAHLRNPAVLAWSYSGPIGIRLAVDPRVAPRALILAASFARNPHPVLGTFRFLASPCLLTPLSRMFRARALLGGRSSPELRRLLGAAHSSLSGRVLSERVRAILAVDESRLLPSIPVPLLYLRSSRDIVVPAWNSRLIAELCRRAGVVTIPGPHLALATAPEAAASAIWAFLSEHTSA